eukprot:Ihof_evm1s443 gene=Ihof_evmTU1s443
MVKPLRTPDGETVCLKTKWVAAGKGLLMLKFFTVEDKHDVLYTTGKVLITTDEEHMFTICTEDVKITELKTGKLVRTLKGDGELITVISLSPDDNTLIAASRSLQIRRYDWTTGEELSSFKSMDGPISVMAWDPTSTLLATGASDGNIKVWDAAKGFVTHSFKGSVGVVSALAFHPDPKRLLLASSAATECHVRLWDLQTKTLFATLEGHNSAVRGLAFSAEGKNLVSASRDKTACVWKMLPKGAKLITTIPVMETVEALCMLPAGISFPAAGEKDKEFYATIGDKGVITIWGLTTGHLIHTSEPGPTTAELVEMTLLPASQQLAVVTIHQDIMIHSLPDLKSTRHIIGYNDEVIDLKVLDDEYLVVATNSEQLRMLRLDDHSCYVVRGHEGIVLAVDVSMDGQHVITSSKDTTLRLWRCVKDDEGNVSFPCLAIGTGHTEGVGAVAFSKKAPNFVVSGSQDRTVKLWSTADFCEMGSEVPSEPEALQARMTQKAHDKDINAIAVAPNDRMFATASHDRTAKVWSTSDMSLLGTLKGHKRGIWHLDFSPVDQCLATASGDKTIKIWSVADFTCLKTLEGHTAGVLKVTYLTRGLQLASAAADGLVKIWTLRTTECATTMDGHIDKVWALTKTSSESEVISGGGDSVINVWKDTTEIEDEKKAQKEEEMILMEQELSNFLQGKQYAKAMALALRLGQPRRVRTLAQELLQGGSEGEAAFATVIKGLQMEQLGQLLGYVRDWNTNAKHSLVAQAVLACVLHTFLPAQILLIPNIKEIIEGLLPYTERHLGRVDRLVQRSFLVDYTWQSLKGGVAPMPEVMLEALHPMGSSGPEVAERVEVPAPVEEVEAETATWEEEESEKESDSSETAKDDTVDMEVNEEEQKEEKRSTKRASKDTKDRVKRTKVNQVEDSPVVS